jgi:glucose/arabinose dehydrogenase
VTALHRTAAVVALAVTLVASAACSSGKDDAATTTTTDRSPAAAPATAALARAHDATETVAELDAPIALATRAGSHDLYVAEKGGKVIRLVASAGAAGGTTTTTGAVTFRPDPTPVLDVSSKVVAGGEQGLLGLAFSSDGRRLFTFSTLAPDGTSSLDAYDIGDATAVTSRTPRHQLLSLARQHANHNGGQLVFGPDGYLYVGMGDGGSEGDPDRHGQDDTTLFAKILRIDPGAGTGTTAGTLTAPGTAYGIPVGHPFEYRGGRPEIWITGVRNPWRFTFDRSTGDLWVADVGQDHWEEVDRLAATDGQDAGRGANLGWSLVEGGHRYRGANPKGGVLPLYEYSHDHGCSITGGYVYRGTAIRDLDGAYLFADYCEPGLRALTTDGHRVTGTRTFDLDLPQVQSFGEDDAGNVYVLLASGPVLRLVSR